MRHERRAVNDQRKREDLTCFQPPAHATVELTLREEAVVALLCMGYTYEQIGERLGISDRTVEAHVHNVAGKVPPDGELSPRQRVQVWAYWRLKRSA